VSAKRAKVLIVEDEAKLARAIALYLSPRGYDVQTAGHGAEALERVAVARPDVIVADIMMPVMDGYTLCRRLRSDPGSCTIPFLFLTAKDDDLDRIRGLKIGADDYLAKPCDLAEIDIRIQTLLARVEAARRLPLDKVRMSGQLADTELIDLIQALEMYQQAGALLLKNTSESGVLYFKDGRIVGAELGTAEGREPLASLLTWKIGTYVFVPGIDRKEVRLTAGIANVLMDHVDSKSS
jgi:DNA-binding response OmpR family regulator